MNYKNRYMPNNQNLQNATIQAMQQERPGLSYHAALDELIHSTEYQASCIIDDYVGDLITNCRLTESEARQLMKALVNDPNFINNTARRHW